MFRQKFFTAKLIMVLLIFLVAFAVRLVMNAYFQGLSAPPDADMGADGGQYDKLAVNLLEGKGYSLWTGPTAFRAPGLSLLLWLIYRVFGASNYVAARVIFCIIGALTCVVVYFIGKELVSEKIGLIASSILALYPHHAYYSMHFLTEPLFTLMLAVAILCFAKLYRSRRYAYGIPCGLLPGAATTGWYWKTKNCAGAGYRPMNCPAKKP